jgi:hypothetical protein
VNQNILFNECVRLTILITFHVLGTDGGTAARLWREEAGTPYRTILQQIDSATYIPTYSNRSDHRIQFGRRPHESTTNPCIESFLQCNLPRPSTKFRAGIRGVKTGSVQKTPTRSNQITQCLFSYFPLFPASWYKRKPSPSLTICILAYVTAVLFGAPTEAA